MRIPRGLRGRPLEERVARGLGAAVLLTSGYGMQACGGGSSDSRTRDDNGATASTNTGGTDDDGNGGSATTQGGNQPGNGGTGATAEDGGSNAPSGGQSDTFFRADTLKLIKPKLVLKPLGIEQDITSNAQQAVDEGLREDKEPDDGDGIADSSDGDGYVDLNAIIRFIGGVDPTKPGGTVTAGAGLCPFPYDNSQVCGPLALGPFQQPSAYTNGSDCKLDGTMDVAKGACFSSQQGAFTVNIQLIGQVPLENTQVTGSWVDGGKGGIAGGFIRGFLSEEVAKNTKLPAQLPLAARLLSIRPNTPLIEFLPGNPPDKQAAPAGWWFTLQYTAKPALYDASVGPDGKK